MRARCYPWNMPKHHFHKMNPQVPSYSCISQDILGYPWLTILRQDCCMILPPYPFSLDDPTDMSLEDAWHARPQLFFKCLLRPHNGRPPKHPCWTRDPDDIEACLVFFSTFEEVTAL